MFIRYVLADASAAPLGLECPSAMIHGLTPLAIDGRPVGAWARSHRRDIFSMRQRYGLRRHQLNSCTIRLLCSVKTTGTINSILPADERMVGAAGLLSVMRTAP